MCGEVGLALDKAGIVAVVRTIISHEFCYAEDLFCGTFVPDHNSDPAEFVWGVVRCYPFAGIPDDFHFELMRLVDFVVFHDFCFLLITLCIIFLPRPYF